MTEQRDGNRRWISAASSKSLVYAALFCIGLIVFELVLFPRSYEQAIIGKHLAQGSYLRFLAVLLLTCASIAPVLAFVWAAFASSVALRAVYLFLFSAAIVTEYSCYNAFGRFTSSGDVALALFAGNWRFTVDAAMMYFNYLALIPIAVFGVLLFTTKRTIKHGMLVFALLMIMVASFFAVTTYFTRNSFYTVSFSSVCRSLISFPVAWYIGTIEGMPERILFIAPRDVVDFQSAGMPNNNIVFIVDESVRGDHLSLNGYGKPTSAFLDELSQKGFVKNWGIAAAGTTCSVTSNALLLTGVSELPDRNVEIYKRPTIFRFARSMNYKTYFFDGQVSQAWNGKPEDVSDYGEWVKADELAAKDGNKYEIDGEIARRIREITSTSAGNFIWVSKFGVHKPYTASYPNENNGGATDSWFIPYDQSIGQEALVNDYDEAITYNVQSFFTNLLSSGPNKNTVYIYTSDHGQTLRENGATVSHCSDTRPEAVVPLLMIADPERLNGIDEDYRASHANIFATLLDLMSFPDGERRYKYATSLMKATGADSAPRFYYVGDLQGRNDGRKYPFD
jgi:glucan phosphoethanolaminetransferase (alkaline phosphatase superfamily)